MKRMLGNNPSVKSLMPFNIQRFSEAVPVDDDIPPIEPTPKTDKILPSDIAPEAWKNVETLLVTLSSSIRIQFDGIEERIKRLEEMAVGTSESVNSGVSELKSTMAEFKQLLADATVEVPEEEAKENEQRKEEQKKSSGGYLSRR